MALTPYLDDVISDISVKLPELVFTSNIKELEKLLGNFVQGIINADVTGATDSVAVIIDTDNSSTAELWEVRHDGDTVGTSTRLISVNEAGEFTLEGELVGNPTSLILRSRAVDGAGVVGIDLVADNNIDADTSKLLRIRAGGVERLAIEHGTSLVGDSNTPLFTLRDESGVAKLQFDLGNSYLIAPQDLTIWADDNIGSGGGSLELRLDGSAQLFNNTTGTSISLPTTGSIVNLSGIADGVGAIGHVFDTVNNLVSAGAQIFTVREAGTDVFTIDKDRNFDYYLGQALNWRAENVIADPAFGNAGRLLYDTVANRLKYDSGTAIIPLPTLAELQAEQIWDRAGTTISPQNAGDDLALGTGSITLGGTVDGRDVSTDGSTLDGHLDGGASKHDASEVDVENAYSNIGSLAGDDLETVLGAIDTKIGQEDIWNRVGTLISPQNSGDDLDLGRHKFDAAGTDLFAVAATLTEQDDLTGTRRFQHTIEDSTYQALIFETDRLDLYSSSDFSYAAGYNDASVISQTKGVDGTGNGLPFIQNVVTGSSFARFASTLISAAPGVGGTKWNTLVSDASVTAQQCMFYTDISEFGGQKSNIRWYVGVSGHVGSGGRDRHIGLDSAGLFVGASGATHTGTPSKWGFQSLATDSASAIGYELDTLNNLTTAGAKHSSWKRASTELMSLDKDGNLGILGTVDGRDIATDGSTLDGHLNGGANKHDAGEIDVEGTYSNISGTPTDLETALAAIDSKLGAESLWDRAATTLTPENSGDNINLGSGAYQGGGTSLPLLMTSLQTEVSVQSAYEFRVANNRGSTADHARWYSRTAGVDEIILRLTKYSSGGGQLVVPVGGGITGKSTFGSATPNNALFFPATNEVQINADTFRVASGTGGDGSGFIDFRGGLRNLGTGFGGDLGIVDAIRLTGTGGQGRTIRSEEATLNQLNPGIFNIEAVNDTSLAFNAKLLNVRDSVSEKAHMDQFGAWYNHYGSTLVTDGIGVGEPSFASATVDIINNTFDSGDYITITVDGIGAFSFIETTDWAVGGSASASATNLAGAINAEVGLNTRVVATPVGSVVTITALSPGNRGNRIRITESDGATDNFTLVTGPRGSLVGGTNDGIGYVLDTDVVLTDGTEKRLASWRNNHIEKLALLPSGILLGGSSPFILKSKETDSASAIAHVTDTVNSMTTNGARLHSFKNAGVEKAAIDKDGNFLTSGGNATWIVRPSEGGAGIAAAMSAAHAAGGGVVQLLAGTYVVAASILPTTGINNVELRGIGEATILEHDGSGSFSVFVVNGTSVSGGVAANNVLIGDTTITTTVAANASVFLVGDSVRIAGLGDDTFEEGERNEVSVAGDGGTGIIGLKYPIRRNITSINLTAFRNGENNKFKDFRITAASLFGMDSVFSGLRQKNCELENITVDSFQSTDGIFLSNGWKNKVINCKIKDFTTVGNGIALSDEIESTVEHCVVIGMPANGIRVSFPSHDSMFNNNLITNCVSGIRNTAPSGSYTRRLQCNDNKLSEILTEGIAVDRVRNGIISNNLLDNCAYRQTGGDVQAIYGSNMQNVSVIGNNIRYARQGIIIGLLSDNCIVSGNTIMDIVGSPSSAYGTAIQVSGNNFVVTGNSIKNCTKSGATALLVYGVVGSGNGNVCSNNIVDGCAGIGIAIANDAGTGVGNTVIGNVCRNITGSFGLQINNNIADSIIMGNNCVGEGISEGTGTGNDFVGNKS